MKSKRRRLSFPSADADGRSGLQSLQDVMLWPDRVLEGLRSGDASSNAEFELRLYMLYAGKMMFTTDYSGWDCPRWAMDCMATALIKQWQWSAQLVKEGIVFTRACDFGALQQAVLCKVSEDIDGCKSCVLDNIMDRLPTKAQDWIQAARPAEEALTSEKLSAHSFIYEWLVENRKWFSHWKQLPHAGCTASGAVSIRITTCRLMLLRAPLGRPSSLWRVSRVTLGLPKGPVKGTLIIHLFSIPSGRRKGWHEVKTVKKTARSSSALPCTRSRTRSQ